MSLIAPLYTADNCQLAYQLNWSLVVFVRERFRLPESWFDQLQCATEVDGVRLLEHRQPDERTHQFFVSSLPDVSPAEIVRSVKGRWQYLLRPTVPKAFQRNYRLTSVGSAELDVLDAYVGRQPAHHTMADPRVQIRFERLQFHDPRVDLGAIRQSVHGQFVYGLHFVFEFANGESCIESKLWQAREEMIVRAARHKKWLLSRIGVVANHLHVLIGCGMLDAPLNAGLSLLNNLSFVDGMRPSYRYGFFVGTTGPYNRMAIRRRLE